MVGVLANIVGSERMHDWTLIETEVMLERAETRMLRWATGTSLTEEIRHRGGEKKGGSGVHKRGDEEIMLKFLGDLIIREDKEPI